MQGLFCITCRVCFVDKSTNITLNIKSNDTGNLLASLALKTSPTKQYQTVHPCVHVMHPCLHTYTYLFFVEFKLCTRTRNWFRIERRQVASTWCDQVLNTWISRLLYPADWTSAQKGALIQFDTNARFRSLSLSPVVSVSVVSVSVVSVSCRLCLCRCRLCLLSSLSLSSLSPVVYVSVASVSVVYVSCLLSSLSPSSLSLSFLSPVVSVSVVSVSCVVSVIVVSVSCRLCLLSSLSVVSVSCRLCLCHLCLCFCRLRLPLPFSLYISLYIYIYKPDGHRNDTNMI